jgi:peptidoglycan-associated lipoprotein
MKMNQLVFPLVLALAATLATTGCKKGTTRVTPLPGNRAIVHDDQQLPPTQPYNPDPNANANSNPNFNNRIATTEGWRIEDTVQDRSALAAYTVHFAFDSAVVKNSEEASVSAVASALAASANDKLLIEGHCDERGTEEYNRTLGERRALALREALSKAGVSSDRIRTISYGKDKPTDPGHDEAAWAKNRRGEFILCHPKAGV